MKDLIKVQIVVKEQPNSAFYWLDRVDIEGCAIPKHLCTVLTEVEKEEPKEILYSKSEIMDIIEARIPDDAEYFREYFRSKNEIPAPEPKGFCIKRTPENADVLNKWAISQETECQELEMCHGYICSKPSPFDGETTHFNTFIPEGFTELFTVEEFFEKVGYNLEPKESNQLKPVTEPVLIAKAGEKVRIVDMGSYKRDSFIGGHVYELGEDYFEKGDIVILTDEIGSSHRMDAKSISYYGICFEKVVEEPVKEESERIPFDLKLWDSGKYDVVCDNGRIIESLTRNDRMEHPLFGVDTEINEVKWWTLTGHYYSNKSASDFNLFLIPKTETVWVNRFESKPYKTKNSAELDVMFTDFKFIETIEVKRPIK